MAAAGVGQPAGRQRVDARVHRVLVRSQPLAESRVGVVTGESDALVVEECPDEPLGGDFRKSDARTAHASTLVYRDQHSLQE